MTEVEAVQAWKDSAVENLETAEEFSNKWMEIGRNLFNKYLEAFK